MRRRWRWVLLVVGLIILGGLLAARPSGPTVTVSHPVIPLPDGVRLAATVVLPAPMPSPRVPVVVIQTRYWRAFALRVPEDPSHVPPMPREPITERLVAAGYAVVLVDVRGTGASEGAWPHPFSRQEVLDAGEVIRWAAAQPWSDGRVGTTGVSYEGSTALLSAATAGPALKAVLAREVEWDLARELLAPGGVRNLSFPEAWSRSTQALDRNQFPELFPAAARWVVKGVHPVDGDADGADLAKVVAARAVADPGAGAQAVRAPQDAFGPQGPPAQTLGPSAWREALAQSGAALGLWGSWWDAATAQAVLSADRAVPLAEAVVGPWNHEGTASASPLGDTQDATLELDQVVAFFDRHLRGTRPLEPQRARRWYVGGAGQWREGASWPRTQPRAWRLEGAGTLTPGAGPGPEVSAEVRVGQGATTGAHNRWMAGMLRPVDYGDRRAAKGVAAWTSPPLEEAVTLFGPSTFRCRAEALDGQPGALHVLLEAQSPAGDVRFLTDGVVRVEPGAGAALVEVSLLPVGARLERGWRLRVAVAAEDEGTFERLPPSGPGGVRVRGDAAQACGVELPVVVEDP